MIASTKLWIFLISLYSVRSDFVGKLRFSDIFDDPNSESSVCLGKVDGKTEPVEIVRCIEVTESSERYVNVWFQDKEIFSHLVILDRNSWQKANPDNGNMKMLKEIESNFVTDYAAIPAIFPNEDERQSIFTVEGLTVGMVLECIPLHFGPRCMQMCNETESVGRYFCHPQTGEKICEAGWVGKECSRKAINGTSTNVEVVKSRPKRSDCAEEPCSNGELLHGGRIEMDYLGAESLNGCSADCSQAGTQLCMVDEEEGSLCKCKPGYSGIKCTEMDICVFELCENGAECKRFEDGESVCECPDGFAGRFCESEIDNCLDEPCGEFGECVSDITGFRCTCDAGFEGERCEIDVDECADKPCLGRGHCYDGRNTYDCDCYEGFYGKSCEHELNGCESDPCQNGGNCSNDGMDFHCQCPEGYGGVTCLDNVTNPCDPNTCNGQGSCYAELKEDPENNSYKNVAACSCNPGYIGEHCELSVSFCDVAGACPTNATCVSLNEEYTCLCPTGFQGQYCHEECEDCQLMDELRCEEDPCRNGGRCVAAGQDIRCVCQRGFFGSRCDYEINYCLQHPCKHGICESTREGHKCLCNEGYTGDRCEKDIDECKDSVNLCKNEGECVNTLGGYECSCRKGYAGTLCELSIDACTYNNPCHNGGLCRSQDEYSFKCECVPGYVGRLCDQAVSCEDNLCKNGGKCEIKPEHDDYYVCVCAEGFHGRHCEQRIHPCTTKKALIDGTYEYVPRKDCGSNGICQLNGETDYKCKCMPGYTGTFCDQEIRITKCEDPYCVCESALPNHRSLNRKQEKSSCQHPSYGLGTCSPSKCLTANCRTPPQFTCQYDSQCADEDISPEVLEGKYMACARVWITLNRAELPSETTVQGVCNRVRKIPVLKNVHNIVAKCFLHSQTDSTSVISISLEGRRKSNSLRVREEFLKYLEDLLTTDNLTKIEDESTVTIFEAIANVTDGRYAIYANNRARTPNSGSPAKTNLIISICCVALFVIVVFAIGLLLWMKKRKPSTAQSPVATRAENNNFPVDSVKYSKQSNGKVNPLFFEDHTEVFYVDTEKNKDISRMEPTSKDTSTNVSSVMADKSTQNFSDSNNSKR